METTIRVELRSALYREDGIPVMMTFMMVDRPTPVKIKKALRSSSRDSLDLVPLVKHFLEFIKKYPECLKFDYKNKETQINIIKVDNKELGYCAFFKYDGLPAEDEKREIKVENDV
jgi:hypothetical protein